MAKSDPITQMFEQARGLNEEDKVVFASLFLVCLYYFRSIQLLDRPLRNVSLTINLINIEWWRGVFALIPEMQNLGLAQAKLNGKLFHECTGSELDRMFDALPRHVQGIYVFENQLFSREELDLWIQAKKMLEKNNKKPSLFQPPHIHREDEHEPDCSPSI